MPRGVHGSAPHDIKIRELREGLDALSNVTARMLTERDSEIARLTQEVERYRAALTVIAGSADRLQASQAICALDNIGPNALDQPSKD